MGSASSDRFARALAALAQNDADLATMLAAADASGVEVRPARSGALTATLVTPDGPLALNSGYDPVKEADDYLAKEKIPADRPCALVGCGLGYLATALERKLVPSVPLLVFEPSLPVLRACLENGVADAVLRSRRAHWFGGADAKAQGRLLEMAEQLADGLTILMPPASSRRLGDEARQIEKMLADTAHFAAIARTTKIAQGSRTVANLTQNLAMYANAISLSGWQDRWRGFPALVVSAGPSLAKNRHRIADIKGRALVIAVGTALKQLLAVDIEPDVVVQIDHSDLCQRHFDGVKADIAAILLADPRTSPAALAAWPGRVAMIHHPLAEYLLGPLARPMPRLPAGLTVAHSAFSFAQFCGADPIILVGQDLAFTGGVTYSPGAGLHEIWRGEVNEFHSIETREWERLARRKREWLTIPDWSGQPVLSDRQMLSYLRSFEQMFAEFPGRVIDSTEGGAAKRGATPMPLEEAITSLLRGPFPDEWLEVDARSVIVPHAMEARLDHCESRFRDLAERFDRMHGYQVAAIEALARGQQPTKELDAIATEQLTIQRQFLQEFRLALLEDGNLEVERNQRTRAIEAAQHLGGDRLVEYLRRDAAYVDGLGGATRAVADALAAARPGPRLPQGIAQSQ